MDLELTKKNVEDALVNIERLIPRFRRDEFLTYALEVICGIDYLIEKVEEKKNE